MPELALRNTAVYALRGCQVEIILSGYSIILTSYIKLACQRYTSIGIIESIKKT